MIYVIVPWSFQMHVVTDDDCDFDPNKNDDENLSALVPLLNEAVEASENWIPETEARSF